MRGGERRCARNYLLVSWLCVTKDICYEILSSVLWKMFWPRKLRLLCSLGLRVVLSLSRRDAEGQTQCQVAVGGLTPVFSLICLRKSSSLLFFLIKSHNIWCAREDSFNVANITAGVILAILAFCFMHRTFIKATAMVASNTVIQSFKPPLWKSLEPQP